MKSITEILDGSSASSRDLFIKLADDPRSYLQKNGAVIYSIGNEQIRCSWPMGGNTGRYNNFIHIDLLNDGIRIKLTVGEKSHWRGALLRTFNNKEKGIVNIKAGEEISQKIYDCIRDANEYVYIKFIKK